MLSQGWSPRGRFCTPWYAPRSWSDLSPASQGWHQKDHRQTQASQGTVKGQRLQVNETSEQGSKLVYINLSFLNSNRLEYQASLSNKIKRLKARVHFIFRISLRLAHSRVRTAFKVYSVSADTRVPHMGRTIAFLYSTNRGQHQVIYRTFVGRIK